MNFESIIDQINKISTSPEPNALSTCKFTLHQLGFEQVFSLCQYAFQHNASFYVLYVLFTVLSTLISPNLTPSFLDQLIQYFIQMPFDKFPPYVHSSLSRCISICIFHRLNVENISNSVQIIQSLPTPMIIKFLFEYSLILKNAADVQILKSRVFYSLTSIFPVFYENIINSILQKPDQDLNNLYNILSSFYCKPKLLSLSSDIDSSFNIDDFLFQIYSKFLSLIPEIIRSWENNTFSPQQIVHFISFLSDSFTTLSIANDESNLEALSKLINTILNPAHNNFSVLSPLFYLLKLAKNKFPHWQYSDISIQFLCAISVTLSDLSNIQGEKMENLESCLSLMVHFSLPPDEQENPFEILPLPIFASGINSLISKQLETISGLESDDEDFQNHIDDICDSDAWLSKTDPSSILTIITKVLSISFTPHQAQFSLCLLYHIISFLHEDEKIQENLDFMNSLISFLGAILPSSLLLEAAATSTYLTIEILKMYKILFEINENDHLKKELFAQISYAAKMTFQFIISTANKSSPHFHSVLQEFLDVAPLYHFSIENLDEVSQSPNASAFLQVSTLQKIAYSSPSDFALRKAIELLQADDNCAKQGAAILFGLVKVVGDSIDFKQFIPVLFAHKLIGKAMRIMTYSTENDKNALEVMSEAKSIFESKINFFDDDEKFEICNDALKTAIFFKSSPFTQISEIALSFVPFQTNLSEKTIKLVVSLFESLMLEKVMISEASMSFLVNFFVELENNDIYFSKFNPILLRIVSFYYDSLNSLLTDDFWNIAFLFYMKHVKDNKDIYSLFFQLGNSQPEKFFQYLISIISSVMPYEEHIKNIQNFHDKNSFSKALYQIALTYQYYVMFQ